MRCNKCKEFFYEHELELSHDVPKYMGGTDGDGRHYLCKKCHDVYERIVFSVAFNRLSPFTQKEVQESIREFAQNYFKRDDENTEGASEK